MSKQRDFALPAVEIGARRITMVLRNRQRAQRAFNFLVGTAVVFVAYTLGKAPLALVVPILLSGVALGSVIRRLRAFGESYRGVQAIAPMMVAEEAQAMRQASR
jgi:hypothetical protein